MGNHDGWTQSTSVGCWCIWLSGPGFQDLDKRTLLSSSSVVVAMFLQRECCCIWLSGPRFQDLVGVCLSATTTLQRQNVTEVGSAIELSCQTDRRTDYLNVTEAGSAIENAETGSAIELSCLTDRLRESYI